MSLKFTNFYFETSAVNYLSNRFDWKDAVATKGLQNAKGNLWHLSPITIWEILLTKNEDVRESLIFYCQHLFHPKLIKSPSEIIFTFLNNGCPNVENNSGFYSALDLSNTWEDICKDKRKTFVYDYNALSDRMKIFQQFSKQISRVINKIILNSCSENQDKQIQDFISYHFTKIEHLLAYRDDDYKKVIKISLLFVLFIICVGIDVDTYTQNKFWKKHNILEVDLRFEFLLKHYTNILFRGPIYQMSIMAFHQNSNGQKGNRGLLMDSFHCIYLTYTDLMITNDVHFSSLKEKDLHPNFRKIFHINDLQIDTYEREIINPD